MSSSQASDNQIQQKTSQQQLKHQKQIIKNGKQIAPFLDEQTLLHLYKSYYSSEKIFYDQLEIKAKQRKLDNQNRGDWIVVGNNNQVKKKFGNSNYANNSTNNSNRKRYNFLEDKELIRRAQNMTQNDFKLSQSNNQNKNFKGKVQYKEKDHPNHTNNSNLAASHKVHYQEKKVQKFKEKVQNQKDQNTKNASNKHGSGSDHHQMYKQKETQTKNQNHSDNHNKHYKYQEKKQKQTVVTSTKAKFIAKQQIQKQEKKPIVSNENSKIETKDQKDSNKNKALPVNSPPIDKSAAQKKFQQECNKNHFILKFIKPTQKVQKISYIMRDGNIQEVKTRLLLPQNEK